MTIYQSPLQPYGSYEHLSIPQFMTKFNPEETPSDKIVHTDAFNSQPLTYCGLRQSAARIAWGMKEKLGLQQGDIVLALVPNSNDFVQLAHGTWWAGCVFAPMNIAATEKDILHAVGLVKPSCIAVVQNRLSVLQAAIQSLPVKPKVFTVLGKDGQLPHFPEDIAGRSDDQSLPPLDLGGKSGKDTASSICFSSGTTGNMKGVMLSHHNLIANVLQYHQAMATRLSRNDREVWFTPYSHLYGMFAVILHGAWVGSYFHALPGFDLETFCAKVSELKANVMHIVPPVALALTASPIAQKYDMSEVRRVVVAAAPIKKPLQERLKARFPLAVVWQGYGMTECSPCVSHQFDESEETIGSIGKLFPGTDLRLVDPLTGKDVALGEEGELLVRGPQVMMQVPPNPHAATEASFVDGWLKTGDIGKMDKDQNLWITDRLKEMIKYKGFQIAPSEMEDLLLNHPDVIDAAVCAVYDDAQATEVPLAYVSLQPAKADLPPAQIQAVLDGIRAWTDGQVTGYKKLRGGVFHLQTLPKSPTGKILRRMLPAKLKETRVQKL
ncbi:putative amp dependent CoA ligase [Plectosphaerella plurivora]|uniref:Amp dependent CoA ligase n=1 Tax=Plectosphaerella plurivora TaxID=936078 RepID=A0A9P8V5K5_9PEZI|nr:putative amp dependent CoA ligase [Plectosphaerella plurivora]